MGHALEAHAQYTDLLHGEGVAIGTVLEIEAAERLGLSPKGTANRARALLEGFGLPASATPERLAAAWPFALADKKRVGRTLALPVVTTVGEGRVERIAIDDLRRALLPD